MVRVGLETPHFGRWSMRERSRQSARQAASPNACRMRRAHYLGTAAAVVFGAGGVAISLLLFFTLRLREDQLAEAAFCLDAQRRAEAVEQAMSNRLAAVRMVEAFYRGSEVVERHEFREFTTSLLDVRDSGVRALLWVPRVPAAERLAHEEAGRSEGIERYRITEKTSEDQVIPAGDREVYWPIFYVEPSAEYGAALGLDLGQEPPCVQGFRRALELCKPASALCVPLEPERSARCGFGLLAPIFTADAAADGEQSADEVLGFVGGVFCLRTIGDEALSLLPQAPIEMAVSAETQPGTFRTMVVFHGASGGGPDAQEPEITQPGRMRYEDDFELAGSRWRVTCFPEEGFLAERRTWLPAGVLGTGVALSLLLVGYLLLLGGRAVRVERLVAQRTAELKTISDAALDAVIMMDSAGCVVHWNPAAERVFGYSREEVLGRGVHELVVPPRHRQQARDGLREFFRTGSGPVVGKVQEMQAVRKDGSEFPIEISVSAIRLHDQWWAVAVVRDISERQRAAEELIREQRLLREMLDLQERERRLVAYEIHDELAQMLTGAQFKLQAFQQKLERQGVQHPEGWKAFEEGLRLLGDGLAEARRLISGLRPPILDDSGVVAAIEYLATETQDRGGPQIEFVPEVHFERLAPPLESALFRIVQETLNNACRHSRSLKVRIELDETDDHVRLVVQDWGLGFDPGGVDPSRFGLRGIRERARLLGGRAEIHSAPGEGTRITVELPLVEPSDHHTSGDAPAGGGAARPTEGSGPAEGSAPGAAEPHSEG